MDVDCCSTSSYTLSQGEQFEFVNSGSQAVQVTNCNPPLAALAYNVPAAQNGTPGRCAAQAAQNAANGDYTLTVSGCSIMPPHGPVIKMST